jgi:Uma2 family endonuclease
MRHDVLAPWAEAVPDAGRLTADELLALPENEWQYELVEGRLLRISPTGLEHYYVADALHGALRTHAKEHQLGIVTLPDTGFVLGPTEAAETVLSPDIAFISQERMRSLPSRGTPAGKKFLAVAPDLAVEVTSPDQYRPEMAAKARLYLASGVRLVWIAWPGTHEVDVWRAGAAEPPPTLEIGDALDGEDVLPGFHLPLADVFPAP